MKTFWRKLCNKDTFLMEEGTQLSQLGEVMDGKKQSVTPGLCHDKQPVSLISYGHVETCHPV